MLSQETIKKIIGEEISKIEEEQAFLDWEKAQKQLEENIRKRVSQAYEAVGVPEGINLCDNPVARGVKGVSDKVSETIADVTSTIDQTTQKILDAIALGLSAYNLPFIWSTTLSEVTSKIYCSFQTSKQATVEILPELRDVFEFELPPEEEPDNEDEDIVLDKEPAEIIEALLALRERMETVHDNLKQHSNNDFERFEDLMRRATQVNNRLRVLIGAKRRSAKNASFLIKSAVAEEGIGELAKIPLPDKAKNSKVNKANSTLEDALFVAETLVTRNGLIVTGLLSVMNKSSETTYKFLNNEIGKIAQKIRQLDLLP